MAEKKSLVRRIAITLAFAGLGSFGGLVVGAEDVHARGGCDGTRCEQGSCITQGGNRCESGSLGCVTVYNCEVY